MSAIFGMLRFDGRDVSGRDLSRASDAMRHRGPDGSRWFADGAVGLGHCMLRVNHEDAFETQPITDRASGVTMVADLRLDNREALASDFSLGAAELAGTPDSALLLRAFLKWGDSCAEHLLGDFAFAIWDGRTKTLLLGRDHMGQRHVHYHRSGDCFVFATDLRGLWAFPEVPQILPDSWIGALLAGVRPTGDGATPFKDIFGVLGGTILTVGMDGTISSRRYWEPSADPAHEGHREPYYIEAYRHVLGEAVACRIRRTARPPGVLFSGGYDSAAIAGLAGSVLNQSGRKLVAASSVMPADYRGTIRHARPWVEMCARDMPHLDVRYVTREGTSVLSGLEQAFLDMGGPAGSHHFVMTQLLSTLASAGVRLIMDGHGGDYTLHPRGQATLARFLATMQLRRFVTELRGHLRLSGHSLGTTLRHDIAAPLVPASLRAFWTRVRRGTAPVWRDRPINQAFAERLFAEAPPDARQGGGPGIDMRARMARVVRHVTSAPAPGNAVAAAVHGLELTRPFHDKRVVELGLAISEDLYVKNGRNRYVACAALKDIYPREFQTRSRRNDDEIPDFQRMVKSIEPELRADLERMERSEKLSGYVNFERIRLLLEARGPDDHNSGWEQDTQLAMLGFVVARYVEWFRRDNR